MYNVRQQQYFLKYYFCYYAGDIDGISGAGTRKAIKEFQQNHRLSADGIWGDNTNSRAVEVTKKLQKVLNEKLAPEKTLLNEIKAFLNEKKVAEGDITKICDYADGILYEGTLEVDGVFGSATREAVEAFQSKAGIEVDGKVGLNTIEALGIADMRTPVKVQDWSKYKYFERSEFVCQGDDCDGKTAEMDSAVLDILTSIREKYGRPVHITSGVRCNHHNSEVGGVWNSRHTQGKAADFYVDGVSGSQLVSDCYALGCRYSYHIVNDCVHCDVN